MARFLFERLFRLLFEGFREIRLRLYDGPIYHRFLFHFFPYYRHLPLSQKGRFLRMVRDNVSYFEFIPRGIELTRGMKTIVASAAAQIAFRLPSAALDYFEKIIIYPDVYHSKITGRTHKGEVNPGLKIIVFSWRAVMDGLDKETDGINLLLHEFAHALWLEHQLTHSSKGVLNDGLVRQFEMMAQLEMRRVIDNEHHFFRKYAFTNTEEFFAVAVENFFERSYLFRKQFPDLYAVLTKLLHQNPAKE